MNFFIDTNLPIGYTVPYDKWHQASINFIDNTFNPIFWSNLVEKEYDDKIDSIIDNLEVFSNKVLKILKDNERDFSSYFEFENYFLNVTKDCKLDDTKKVKFLEDFWIKNKIIEGISEELYFIFIDFKKDLNYIFFTRQSNLKQILELHDCGLDNYLKYYDYALKLYDGGIHKPDCKIVLDAHDCGLIHKDLIFVSNDIDMLKAISQLDTSHLEIMEFKSCN